MSKFTMLGLLGVAIAAGHGLAAQRPWLNHAETFIEGRIADAPRSEHGFVERSYGLQDLNDDGIPEVLETIPDWEASREFLNVEMAPAFEWISIYELDGERYAEATGKFREFLRSRMAHYELWLRLVEAPEALSADSRALVAANKNEFVAAIEGHMNRAGALLATAP